MLKVARGTEVVRDVCHHWLHDESGIFVSEPAGGLIEEAGADVDRNVQPGLPCYSHCAQNDSALLCAPRSKLDECTGTELWNDPRHLGLEQTALGTSRIVLWQPGDLLEELRPPMVVEVFRRKLL